MEFRKASELQPDAGLELSRIFVDGFYQWIKYFSKNKTKLAAAFSDAFNLKYFYVAMEDARIIGMAALADAECCDPVLETNLKTLRKHLGFIGGSMAKYYLGRELEQNQYPFVMDRDTQSIGFVAVDKDFRGRSVAGELLRYITERSPKKRFVLEVASSNQAALRAYEKFGFREFAETKLSEKEQKQTGFERYIYMEYIKQDG